jgi:MFS family permease
MSGSPAPARRSRRVALAGLVGTTIEWYDFFIYGTAAALVFGRAFFPGASPAAGTLAALSTFAVGMVARPVGGALMGHFGDRIGRRSMLVLSLLIMGTGTVLIGLLPTYSAIGVAAPVLLVVLRFAQGLGVGGEWGGATLLALEHAAPSRRTLHSSLPQIGLPLGIVLGSLVFLLVRLGIDGPAFTAWGWRIPFLVSAVLVAFGLVLRLKLAESPEFSRLRDRREVRRAPIADVFRAPRTWIPAAGVNIVASALGNVLLVFTLGYVAAEKLVSASVMFVVTIVSALVWAAAIPLGALLAQRVGRRQVVASAAVLLTLWAFPYFWLLDTGSTAGTLIACAVAGIGIGLASGPYGAFISEAFPAAIRYSGASVAYGIGSVLGGAIAPIVATLLYTATGAATAVSLYLVVSGLVSLVAALTLRGSPAAIAEVLPATEPLLEGQA